ncbi:hypothetical protein Q2T83_01495 [Fervidibacter sacchari]|uniref:Uncharacterized protein n=1 Tax=Candidatus Fervidibacter sacchari TaxID=1448929 RepID=A0ABT2ET66_9BACT|nr:hypothetical protein [Candidatus Fervidibacter sacchari]MCS3921141.1 hypothetical protein [Candidatus Fervidibacter sacchari]WKU16511.1 hypothetical protein Q2T83_01495 [Candidatus Fervidibacter sacchari]
MSARECSKTNHATGLSQWFDDEFGSVAPCGRRLFNCRRGKPRRYLYHFAAVSIVANRYSPFATT